MVVEQNEMNPFNNAFVLDVASRKDLRAQQGGSDLEL